MNDFNFARAPFVNERLPRAMFALSVGLVAALTAFHGFFLTRYLLREQESLDLRVSDLRKQLDETNAGITRAQDAIAQDRSALGTEQTRFLTTLFRRKSFSWTGLFNELETITPPSVRITSVAPAEEKGEISVTMTVVGETLQDVLEMVRALESSSFFATVFPLDEANLADGERGETGIAATLKLDYVEDVRNESPPSAEDGTSPEPIETAEPSESSREQPQ